MAARVVVVVVVVGSVLCPFSAVNATTGQTVAIGWYPPR